MVISFIDQFNAIIHLFLLPQTDVTRHSSISVWERKKSASQFMVSLHHLVSEAYTKIIKYQWHLVFALKPTSI